MIIVELFYNMKKRIIKLYNDYLTINGNYTSILPDKVYITKLYKKRLNKEINLKNPKTYTEKLNWIKLYDRNPIYSVLADKYAVRNYVKEKIGEKYLIPLIGVWNNVDEVDFEKLPNNFVLKCNHDNGVVICKDKSSFDRETAKLELLCHYNRNYYKKCREWSYKKIKKKIICEKYMADINQPVLVDYKFFCFNGRVKALFIATNRPIDTRFDFFDRNFNHLPILNGHPNADSKIDKPKDFDTMINIAEKLAEGFPHVRVDLYYINGQIYFGEITITHFGGFTPLEPDEWEFKFGEWLELPKKKRR